MNKKNAEKKEACSDRSTQCQWVHGSVLKYEAEWLWMVNIEHTPTSWWDKCVHSCFNHKYNSLHRYEHGTGMKPNCILHTSAWNSKNNIENCQSQHKYRIHIWSDANGTEPYRSKAKEEKKHNLGNVMYKIVSFLPMSYKSHTSHTIHI